MAFYLEILSWKPAMVIKPFGDNSNRTVKDVLGRALSVISRPLDGRTAHGTWSMDRLSPRYHEYLHKLSLRVPIVQILLYKISL